MRSATVPVTICEIDTHSGGTEADFITLEFFPTSSIIFLLSSHFCYVHVCFNIRIRYTFFDIVLLIYCNLEMEWPLHKTPFISPLEKSLAFLPSAKGCHCRMIRVVGNVCLIQPNLKLPLHPSQ